ncbi:MAG TPA: hypothetical protein VF132_11620 [Rudaea sp.]
MSAAQVPVAARSRFGLLCAFVVVLALALRLLYAFAAKPENPIRGDINDYVIYAWNLTQTGTFSSELSTGDPVTPDAYRGPGYPAVLALAMKAAGDVVVSVREGDGGRLMLVAEPPRWIGYAYVVQAVLGALTVLLTMLLARAWMSEGAALAAGLLVALWPHLIVFAGTLLGETLFGFALVFALWLLAAGWRTQRSGINAIAGLAFGAAYLVNPIIGLFPVFATAALWRRGNVRIAAIFFVAFAIAPVAWGLRNASLETKTPGAAQRIGQNFVQGSWPQFLTALNSRLVNDISAQIVAAESEEEKTFLADPAAGLAAMRERMAMDPGYYVGWYLLRKPYLLWDWNVRVGWGDIYFLVTPNSPFERIPMLKAMRLAFAAINPIVFAFAALAGLAAGFAFLRPRSAVAFPLAMTAWMALYLTAVHVVLQGEPRYAIAYRPEEVLLAVTGAAWIVARLRDRSRSRKPAAATSAMLAP